MPHVISIINQKGGVGKTTTAVSLSSYLADIGARVLLIDADPQANATSNFGAQSEKTLYDLFWNEDASRVLCSSRRNNLDIIIADPRLSGLDLELAGQSQNNIILRNRIQNLISQYHYIFIDCPPSLGLLTVNSLIASQYFIIPLQCEYFALEGLSRLLETARALKENINSNLSLLGILLTLFDPRNTLNHKVVEQVKKHFNDKVFSTIIPRNIRLSEAPSHCLSIKEYDPSSKGGQAYKKLAIELSEKLPFHREVENVL